MAVETELKLRIAPGQLARLKRHALLKARPPARPPARPQVRRLRNIYFDTPRLELHEAGIALRLRRAGHQWLQTLKGGGSMQAGLHTRNEWEVPVKRAALDFSAAPGVNWDKLLRPPLRRKLQPVFETDFVRSSRVLEFRGAQIEICMDNGEVRAGQKSTPLCEIELELKSGDPLRLFELALAILDVVPFELETVSKAEQGYRLLTGYKANPVKAAAPHLAADDTLAGILGKWIWSCLQHFQGNLHGALSGEDAEYLHQMRVALRRLRVVLRIAEKVRADPVLAGLHRDVTELCVALGRIREWDVFIAQTLQPACARMAGHAGLRALLAASERQRAGCYAALSSEAQLREFQRLLLRFAIWMNGAYWEFAPGKPGTGLPAREFATRRMRKLARRFERAGQHLESADAARLHALRIAAKKLRYSAEFFAELFGGKAAGSFLLKLGEVQDVLGQINDIAVAHRLLDGLAADSDADADAGADQQAGIIEAVALCRGWIAHELAGQLAELKKAMQRFNRHGAFWDK